MHCNRTLHTRHPHAWQYFTRPDTAGAALYEALQTMLNTDNGDHLASACIAACALWEGWGWGWGSGGTHGKDVRCGQPYLLLVLLQH